MVTQIDLDTFDTIESNNEKVYIEQLNNYKPLKNIKQLIILTSTYGLGQPHQMLKNLLNSKNPLKVLNNIVL